jgi:hypothetical protein
VLGALDVFFQSGVGGSATQKLTVDDFFQRRTAEPISITLTLAELDGLTEDSPLHDYVVNHQITVKAVYTLDDATKRICAKYFGVALGIKDFSEYRCAATDGAKVNVLKALYGILQDSFAGLTAAKTKDEMNEALREFEREHPELCEAIEVPDDFVSAASGKLNRYVQWIYVPAVKDAIDEGQEAKNTALGALVNRAVGSRIDIETALQDLQAQTLLKYEEIVARNQSILGDLSNSLQQRLAKIAHNGVQVKLQWVPSLGKTVAVQTPVAGILTGEQGFQGSLSRMGHGLQRSYLLALLQELAASEQPEAPTLILGIEEPELYQHPPQARHLADTLNELGDGNNQILVTTHSPLFLSGEGLENTRVVQPPSGDAGSKVLCTDFNKLCGRIRTALGGNSVRPNVGLIAKIHQALQPGIAELFFARVPVLVEGLEDVSYITTYLTLSGLWPDFRRLGCHLIPVNGKDKLIQPTALLAELGLKAFVIFDADGDNEHPAQRPKHEKDNKALITLLNLNQSAFPVQDLIGQGHAIWAANLGESVKNDFGASYSTLTNASRQNYGHEGGLEKHDLFIADWLTTGFNTGVRSATLLRLCNEIISFADTA